MSSPHHNTGFRNALSRRVALLGLLAILLGQAALLAHETAFDHADEENCFVCSLGDRQDDTLATADTGPTQSVSSQRPVGVSDSEPTPSIPLRRNARAPPA